MKKILIFALTVALILGLIGCTESTVTKEENQENKGNILDQIKDKFKKAGFEIGDNEMIAFDIVHANNGYKFEVDGELIEIYEYDLDNLSEEAKDMVNQAKEGSVEIFGINSSCVWNEKGILMFRADEHSQQDKIIEIFKNF